MNKFTWKQWLSGYLGLDFVLLLSLLFFTSWTAVKIWILITVIKVLGGQLLFTRYRRQGLQGLVMLGQRICPDQDVLEEAVIFILSIMMMLPGPLSLLPALSLLPPCRRLLVQKVIRWQLANYPPQIVDQQVD